MQKNTINRRELYELVWKEPISHLSKKYALSSNGIKKLCEQYNIPIPENGHWQKLKFAKPVKPKMLSDNFTGRDAIELPFRSGENDIEADKSPWVILTHEIANDPKAPAEVPEKLTKPDQLTANTKEYWKSRNDKGYKRDENKTNLPIYNQINNPKRALLLMDTFVKLIRYRGHTITKKYSEVMIMIGEVEIPFSLREATKRMPSTQKYYNYDYVPTGIYVLKTGRYSDVREWKDGKTLLEKQLPKIVAKLEIEAEVERQQMEHSRLWREQYEREEQNRKEMQRKMELEAKRFGQLLEDSERHHKSTMVRNYIKAVEDKAKSENALTDELQVWLSWAKSKTGEYDPLINKKDDLLSGEGFLQ